MKYSILILLFTLSCEIIRCQTGGNNTYQFLNIPSNARIAGLGNKNVSLKADDVNLFLSNPALADSVTDKSISFNHLSLLGNINLSSIAYLHDFKKLGPLMFGVQYLAYGEFEGFDPAGQPMDNFNANEYAVTIGKFHSLGPFTMGVNIKLLSSNIETYSSTALAVDIGGTFSPISNFSLGLAVKNLGVVLSAFTPNDSPRLPFDVQIGTTFKPQYMPFRFSLTASNLGRNNLIGINPDLSNIENSEINTFDKVFGHLNLGIEVLISEHVQLRTGYNHLLRRELRLEETSGGAGFSFGFMFKIKRFEFAYSRAIYSVAGGSNHFTISTNLNRMLNKKLI